MKRFVMVTQGLYGRKTLIVSANVKNVKDRVTVGGDGCDVEFTDGTWLHVAESIEQLEQLLND